jgi:tartrate dehydratase beta subunit/fumarate hydratase class I family protein
MIIVPNEVRKSENFAVETPKYNTQISQYCSMAPTTAIREDNHTDQKIPLLEGV